MILVLVAIATLFVSVVALVLLGHLIGRSSTDRQSHRAVAPGDCSVARAAVAEVYGRANIPGAGPVVRVVPRLGKPAPGTRGEIGARGLAETTFRPGKPLTVTLAVSAVRDLPQDALHHLIAHEIGHVFVYRTSSVWRIMPYVWALGLLVATASTWWVRLVVEPVAAAVIAFAIVAAFVASWSAAQRRDEYKADAYAVRLTGDLGGAASLHAYYEVNGFGTESRLARVFTCWLSSHPTFARRMDRMRSVVAQ